MMQLFFVSRFYKTVPPGNISRRDSQKNESINGKLMKLNKKT